MSFTLNPFLRQVLFADAAVSGAAGLLMVAGAPFLSPLLGLPTGLLFYAGLALFPFVANDLALSLRSFLVMLFLGVFQIGLAYAFFVKGLRYVTATQASLTGMIEPVANPIWVLLFLGEKPSTFAIAGAAIVLAAIAWHTMQGEPATVDLPAPD